MDFSDAGLSQPTDFASMAATPKEEKPLNELTQGDQQLSFASTLATVAAAPENPYPLERVLADSAILNSEVAAMSARTAEAQQASQMILTNLQNPELMDYSVAFAYDRDKQRQLDESVVERKYADTIEDNVRIGNGEWEFLEDNDPGAELMENNPEYAYAINHSVALNATTNNLMAQLDKEWEEERTYAGLIADFVSTAFPLWESYKLGTDPFQGETFWAGENRLIELGKIWAMPTEQAIATIKERFKDLKGNAFTAYDFLSAIQSYSTSDKMLESAFNVVDLGGIGASSVKLLGRGMRGVNSIPNVTGLAGGIRNGGRLAYNQLRQAVANPVSAVHSATAAANASYSWARSAFTPSVAPRAAGAAPNYIAGAANEIARTDRLVSEFKSWRDRAGWVIRTKDTGLDEARRLMEEDFRKRLPSSATIMDVSPVIRDPKRGSHYVKILIGEPNGGAFSQMVDAGTYGEHLGLPFDTWKAVPAPGGWAIEIEKSINERLWAARDPEVLLTKHGKTKPLGFLQRFILSANQSFSEWEKANRGVTASLAAGRATKMRPLLKQIKFDSKKSKKLMSRVLLEGNRTVDPTSGELGKWFSATELENQFRRLAGREPTSSEYATYHAIRKVYDLMYKEEMFSLLKNMEARGIEEISLAHAYGVDKVHGVNIIEDKARILGSRYAVLKENGAGWEIGDEIGGPFKTPNSVERFFGASSRGKNFTVTELVDPQDAITKLGMDEPVKYVITRQAGSRRLQPGESILPYRGGGHTAVKGEWFVKLPQTFKNWYTSDKTLFSFGTEKAAMEAAQKLENAKNDWFAIPTSVDSFGNTVRDPAQTRAFLQRIHNEFGFRPGDWRELIKSISFPDEQKFTATKSATRALENTKLLSMHSIKDDLGGVYQMTDYKNYSFVGQREDRRMTTLRATPAGTFAERPAAYIDPLDALEQSVHHMQAIGAYEDYAFQSISDWMRRYKDLLEFTPDELRSNPTAAFLNPRWKAKTSGSEEAARMLQAKAQHSHITDFLQTPTETGTWVRGIREKFVEWAGEEAFDAENFRWRMSSKDYGNDPMGVVKAYTFNLAMGFAQVTQFALQSSAVTLAMAIDPANIRPAMGLANAYLLGRKMGLHSRVPGIDGFFSKLSGVDPADIGEFAKYIDNSGALAMENTLADLSVGFKGSGIGGTQKTLSKVGRFAKEHHLDPYKGGEAVLRLYAHASAFSWWRARNPGKAINNAAIHEMRNRAGLMFGNMSRESNSYWQRGVFSVPTQFSSFFVRYHELLLGRELSVPERARLFLTMTAMYGVGGSTLLGDLGAEQYKKATADEGPVEPGFNLENIVLHGMMDAITGYSVQQRFGPAGTQLVDAVNEKDVMLAFGGPSGNKIYQIIRDMGHMSMFSGPALIMKGIWGNGTDNLDTVKPGVELMLSTLRNISSVNSAYKSYMALKTERYISKSGVLLEDSMTPMDSIVLGLFGIEPSQVTLSRDYLFAESVGSKGLGVAMEKDIIMNFHQKRMTAMLNGDLETAGKYTDAVAAYMEIIDMPHEDRARYWGMYLTETNEDYETQSKMKQYRDLTGTFGTLQYYAQQE